MIKRYQWQIEDFPEGRINPGRKCANLVFGNFFVKHCVKLKEIEPKRERVPGSPLDIPIGRVIAF